MARRRQPLAPTIPGFNTRRTSKGWLIVEIDPWADPAKDAAWLEAKRCSMPSEVAFRREFLRDWTSAAGTPFYPEFVENPKLYIRPCTGLIPGLPVIRGWDFGYRRPACVWFQVGPTGRVWFLREVMGVNIDTHSFRDLVLYLSGQLDIELLKARPKAMSKVLGIRENPKLPEPPWFNHNPEALRFRDYAGPEALKRHPEAEGDDAARVDAEILGRAGIHLATFYTTPKGRAKIMRRLLLRRPDGHPGALFDPACRELILGMGGGITFAKPTKGNQEPDEPNKDGEFEHLHDAAGYGLAGELPADEENAPPAPTTVYEGREPHLIPQGDGWPIHEVHNPDRW
jgi:hypothetical protein